MTPSLKPSKRRHRKGFSGNNRREECDPTIGDIHNDNQGAPGS